MFTIEKIFYTTNPKKMRKINENLLRRAMNEGDKKINLNPDKNEVYTATPDDLKNILNFFTGASTTRIIYLNDNKDRIDTSKTYEVMKDENWNEFILIYFINQTKPVKCIKYKKGITWFAYDIKEDGTIYIWFYKNGNIQHIKLCKINIKEGGRGKKKRIPEPFDENPISYEESTKQDRENQMFYDDDKDSDY